MDKAQESTRRLLCAAAAEVRLKQARPLCAGVSGESRARSKVEPAGASGQWTQPRRPAKSKPLSTLSAGLSSIKTGPSPPSNYFWLLTNISPPEAPAPRTIGTSSSDEVRGKSSPILTSLLSIKEYDCEIKPDAHVFPRVTCPTSMITPRPYLCRIFRHNCSPPSRPPSHFGLSAADHGTPASISRRHPPPRHGYACRDRQVLSTQ